MKTLLSRKLSLVFLIVQFLISAALVGVAFYVGFIPLKYIVALIVLCLFLLAYEVFSQMTDKIYIVGRVLCALISAVDIIVSIRILPLMRWRVSR